MLFHLQRRGLLAAVACLGVFASAAPAVTVFDFEDQATRLSAPPVNGRAGDLTSLHLAKDGLQLTVTREQGRAFDLVSNAGGPSSRPSAWGGMSLDPMFGQDGAAALVGTFNAPVHSVSLEFADFSQGSQGFLMEAYSGPNGSGALLGTNNVAYSSAFTTYGTSNVTAAGIRSVRLVGPANGAPSNIYYDNIRVDSTGSAIPEPGSAVLLAGALPMLGLLRRRAR